MSASSHSLRKFYKKIITITFLLTRQNASADSWILIWSDAMMFLKLSKEIYNNGKSNDIGFKPEAWVGFQANIS